MTDWELRQVGFLEKELVLHCGASTASENAHSLSALEIESVSWEAEAVMDRAQSKLKDRIATTGVRRICFSLTFAERALRKKVFYPPGNLNDS
ncbi:hypothetical protein D4R89_10795 [bacterium]|nr:MAG: hypothetical protein D4R89_10795 [bacterium]